MRITRKPTPIKAWEDGYRILLRFVKRYGHAFVPSRFRFGGFELGGWVSAQRRAHQTGQLVAERRRKLERLPHFAWHADRKLWDLHYQTLVSYVKEHGSADVRATHYREGFGLGSWVSRQRKKHRLGRLTDDQRRRLERLPGWKWEARTGSWDDHLESLKRYARRYRTTQIHPRFVDEDGFHLGTWIILQRYRHISGMLAADRIRKLEAVPYFTWNPPHFPRGRGAEEKRRRKGPPIPPQVVPRPHPDE